MENKAQNREKRNLILFIISYVINNLASGVMYDTYVNYMQEVSLAIATSFWAFYGYATFLSAAILLLIPRIGYKKILIFCIIESAVAFFIVVFFQKPALLFLATLLGLTGVQLHFIILAPYVAAFTENLKKEEIRWYTRTYYMGYVGYFLSTYLGGVFVVKLFSLAAGVDYLSAKSATRFISEMTPEMYQAYLIGNRYVLLAVGCIGLAAIFPVLFIQEEPSDYKKIEKQEEKTWREKIKEGIHIIFNKDARTFILFWILISFAMGLFTSYYTVFLNRNLHIDKATSSLLVSISYIAIVLFMFFTPFAVKRLGQVGTIVFSVLLSVPFMLVIANGDRFNDLMIPVVGVALFVRSGLANLSSPAESSLSMSVVPKNMRPAYTALVNFLAGVVSIVSGNFTGNFLFKEQVGYKYAYYIAAVLYSVAAVILYIGLRKYNRKEDRDGSL
ncbi:MAG: MFS transporter [Peptostreptococcaceae bacterium]|nr:MFS transporter [Peptostreptococcaceae bacterium]